MLRKGRKPSGAKYIKRRKKKKREIAGQKKIVKLGKEKRKIKRVQGGKIKTFSLTGEYINLKDKQGKTQKTEIKNVLQTPSNKFLARQNIITKGTIIQTELGKAKITNRPSQEGTINGILIE